MSGYFLDTRPGHDAFRRAAGSLNPAYPVLTLLRRTPARAEDLAGWLHMPKKRITRLADALVAAGVARRTSEGYARVSEPLRPLLDAVAVGAGTSGDRQKAAKRYQDEAKQHAAKKEEWREKVSTVGTPEWREERAKDCDHALGVNTWIVEEWSHRTGRSRKQLIERILDSYVQHRAQQALTVTSGSG